MLICLLAILIRILLIIVRIPLGIIMVIVIAGAGIMHVLKAIGINFTLRRRRDPEDAPRNPLWNSVRNFLRRKPMTVIKEIPALLKRTFHTVKDYLVSKGIDDKMSAVLAAIVLLVIV